jgi:predicted ATPase/class 3 adenylate cyclase
MEQATSFGYWLRRRRRALDLTQEELARQVGCALETIKKIETDVRRPSRQMAERLADVIQLSPEERSSFLKAARAELAPDRLTVTTQPIGVATATMTTMPPPSGTVTFLFTDIVGSTQLWAQHAAAMRVALARHDTLLRQTIESHYGYIFKTVGDAFCAAFATAADALAAAIGLQRALQSETWQATGPLRVRAALHTGAAEVRANDYFGHTLSRVSRLRDVGHGHQTLLSLATAELVRDQLPPGVMLRDLGNHQLKSLERPEQIFQLIASDLPGDFPPLKIPGVRTSNLPAHLNALIGREREVAAVVDLLRRVDTRLVTLTGPGGMGKTRLGVQVAADMHAEFTDGVVFVGLASISDPNLVALTIFQVLNMRESGEPPLESLKAYLHRKRMLLLLDNFEQVADAAPVVAELLAAAPDMKILVTSRMPLRLSGEHEFAVPPLALPPRHPHPPATYPASEEAEHIGNSRCYIGGARAWEPGDEVAPSQYEAVRLFIERAQAAKADFALTNANASVVAKICHRLDGLPLAIELAAARVKLFSPQALLARLDHRLQVLTGGARDLPARQQTIRATIDWSFNLLSVAEQQLFARLGVFVGGCTLETAEVICDADSDLPWDVVDGLAALLDKNLLHQVEGPDGELRFAMLETIHEYALERLVASGEETALRERHATYYLSMAETAEREQHGSTQQTWLARLEIEHDNLRATLDWFRAQADDERLARLCAALAWFWWLYAHFGEGRRWADLVIARRAHLPAPMLAKALFECAWLYSRIDVQIALLDESLALYRTLDDRQGMAMALNRLGGTLYFHGDDLAARAPLEEGLALSRMIGYKWDIAQALTGLGQIALTQGDYALAIAQLEESLVLNREVGDRDEIGGTLYALGEAARLQGDFNRAAMFFAEALAREQELGDRRGIAAQLGNLGAVALAQGDIARATSLFEESLSIYRDIGWQQGIGWALHYFAEVACTLGQPERAARLLGAEKVLREALSYQIWPTRRADYECALAAARAALGEEVFMAAWAAGQAMTIEEVIAEALGNSESRAAI